MKVFIYVEGPSDVLALKSLWEDWRTRLRSERHGIEIIHLDNKATYFKKIGHRASEKLVANDVDVVVGLPDLYPNKGYNGKLKHDDVDALKKLQMALVKESLQSNSKIKKENVDMFLDRFYPCALKHDLEMLLLASVDYLRKYLDTDERLVNKWIIPVEDQNQETPPKKIVEQLFLSKKNALIEILNMHRQYLGKSMICAIFFL